MKTVIQDAKKNALESYYEDGFPRITRETDTMLQDTNSSTEKSFRVVDLWKIRNMKKYFNYK